LQNCSHFQKRERAKSRDHQKANEMKHLKLTTAAYNYILKSYKEWLEIMGYAKGTVKTFPVHVKEYLHYLENEHKIRELKAIKRHHGKDYISYLKTRENKTRGGGLMQSTINKQVVAINVFISYLSQARELNIEPISIRSTKGTSATPIILSKAEIEQLYKVTYDNTEDGNQKNIAAYGARDRAMLSLLYGCGLRINECRHLNIEDVDLQKGELIVRTGKGDKQRIVPMVGRVLEYIENYLNEHRYWFTQSHAQHTWQDVIKPTAVDRQAVLLNEKGSRLEAGHYGRLKKLKERANIEKRVTPHILRHSIATHLLAAGMELESIGEFLGHSSLESTQIYTHIANDYGELQELAE
jgi:integrase/recombinase XerD